MGQQGGGVRWANIGQEVRKLMRFTTIIILIQLSTAVVVYSMIAKFFVWPRLKKVALEDALIPLLFVLSFRYIGLIFFLPEMLGSNSNPLPSVWAIPVGLGDMLTGVLSLITILLLRSRNPIGIPLAWTVVTIGTIDFLYAYLVGIPMKIQIGGPGYFIPILFNPAMFVATFMIFKLLLSKRGVTE